MSPHEGMKTENHGKVMWARQQNEFEIDATTKEPKFEINDIVRLRLPAKAYGLKGDALVGDNYFRVKRIIRSIPRSSYILAEADNPDSILSFSISELDMVPG